MAVVAVLLFHFGIPPFAGGFVGVDVFFVISGYLITAITLGELAAGRFSVVSFYERRLRRILPALAVVLVFATLASLFLFLPPDLRFVASGLTAAATFWSNFLFYSASNNYFAAGNLDLQPMLHTWSLSVEMQFYLVYPWLLVLLRRRGWSVSRALAVIAALSLALSLWGVVRAPNATFYLLPARAWELLLGGWLAAVPWRPSRRSARTAAGLGGFGAVAAAVLLFTRETPFPGGAALLPCLGAALIIWAGRGDDADRAADPLARLLRAAPVVFVGRISYSLYLWHWPLLVFSRYGAAAEPSPAMRVGLIGLTVALAALSWRFVERPVLQRRLFPSAVRLYAASFGTMLVTALAGVGVDQVGRGTVPLALVPEPALTYANAQYDRVDGDCRPPASAAAPLASCILGQPGVAPSVAVWGNSYVRMWSPTLDLDARAADTAALLLTRGKCLPIDRPVPDEPPDCAAFNRAALEAIDARPELKTVLLGANWFAAGDALESLGDTVARLQASGRRVVVVLAPPQPNYSVPRTLAMAALRGQPTPPAIVRSEAAAVQRQSTDIIEGLRQRYGFAVIDPASAMCDATTCAVLRDGRPVYYDAGHVTVSFAKALAGLFAPAFRP